MTSSATCVELVIEGTRFQLVDSSGQPSERHKWWSLFDGAVAVLFFVGLDSYDKTSCEDRSTNRMADDIELFSQLVHHPSFRDITIAVFMNKFDLFQTKLELFPLDTVPKWQAEYLRVKEAVRLEDPEATEVEASIHFFQTVIQAAAPNRGDLFLRPINSTDTTNALAVWEVVRQAVMDRALAWLFDRS